LAGSAGRTAGIAGLTATAADEKVRWIAEGATAAGRRSDDLELQVSVLELQLVGSTAERTRVLSSLSEKTGLDAPTLEDSPAVLVGSVDACAEKLSERRERFGFSYIKLGPDAAAAAPIVARLAGS
jgi:alkanesulfonate monooxygenase SsuD/methylene tetrahydromethanopterin reductase-like flavin-dependent oxidoreductase (luciferase family)